jgi:hypothetical protein
MKVTSTTSVEFPKLKWSIRKGETKDLPKDQKEAEHILAHSDILKVEETKVEKKKA